MITSDELWKTSYRNVFWERKVTVGKHWGDLNSILAKESVILETKMLSLSPKNTDFRIKSSDFELPVFRMHHFYINFESKSTKIWL